MNTSRHTPVRMTRTVVLVLISSVIWAVWSATADFTAQEANIARAAAGLLKRSHFSAEKSDAILSIRFFDRYLDQLDPAKMLLLQEDVAEFAEYRTKLSLMTLQDGNLTPARKIFDRYLERLAARVEMVTNLLQTVTFTFDGTDQFQVDRKNAPRPASLDDAKQLWRQHLRYEYLQERLNGKKPDEIKGVLTRRHERTLRTMKQFDHDRIFEMYLTALARVYDPHSDYMGPRQLEEFHISMSLSLFGIGAVLLSEDGTCKIRELIPGGPAEASGQFKPGDSILAVAQDGKEPVDCVEMPLQDIVAMIRGPKGTKVTLTILPANAPDSSKRRDITLVRDEIKLEKQEAKARIVDRPGPADTVTRIGIIELPSFYSGNSQDASNGSTADVAKLIGKLKMENVQGIILDLRRNGGGSLEEAIRLSGLFIRAGPIVQTQDNQGGVQVARDPDPSVLYDGPLVVLTSRVSASASEILAAAMQDYGRAVIVGDTATYGKGTVQSVIQLGPLMRRNRVDAGDNPGALKLTIRKFYRPNGGSTQLKGVESDIVLPSPMGLFKISESEMETALPWDEIRPVLYEKTDRVAPHLDSLRTASAKRLETNTEFQWLREDIERGKERMANPFVSLNEKQRRDETSQIKERLKARQQARAKQPSPKDVQFEITVRQASQPGLPDPLKPGVPDKSIPQDDDEWDEDLEETDTVDTVLDETKNILSDYIRLWHDFQAATPPAETR